MYGYRYYSSSGAAALLGFLAAVVSLIFLVLMVYWIISYIFSSIAYYKISKRRGYQRPWLAWIPFARNYLYGAIADDINIKRGKKTYFGWILLVLNLCSTGALAFLLGDLRAGGHIGMGGYIIGSPWSSLIGLATTVLYYIALSVIYRDYMRGQITLMLVLSIVFPFISPFVLFSIRNKPSVSCGEAAYGGFDGFGGYGGYQNYGGDQGGSRPGGYPGDHETRGPKE
mgnify:FL=1